MSDNTTHYDLRFLEALDADRPDNAPIEALTDGDYDFVVRTAAFKPPTATKSMVIIEMILEVESPGKHQGSKIQFPMFIQNKDGRDRVLRDLGKLGFDVNEWTIPNNRPISVELQKVPRVLPGLRFKAKKSTSGQYHNLNILKRILTDGKPPVLGADLLDTVPEPSGDDPFPV